MGKSKNKNTNGVSPMMNHYRDLKKKYPDCIVFYRLGDFYEMFDDDAKKASEMLDLTLTGRDCGEGKRAPMCGVPFHSADSYIAKLVSFGEKVAICEQLTPPTKGELVIRDVVKIVTAGTITDNQALDDKANNFLACVYANNNEYSVAWVDITTGEFYVKSFLENAQNSVCDFLVKISPAEIIANQQASQTFNDFPIVKHGVIPRFSEYLESQFSPLSATKLIKEQLGVSNLASINLDNENYICVSGALLSYLKETQKHALKNITEISVQNASSGLTLDGTAIKNLELVKTLRDGKRYGSLLWLLDKTKTSMGARKLHSWILSPLYDIEKIKYRQDGVESFYNNTLIREEVAFLLSSVRDVARITGKLSNGNLTPKDCEALKKSLEIFPSLKFKLLGFNNQFILDILASLPDFNDLVSMLDNAFIENPPATIKDGGYIKEGFSVELDEIRNIKDNSKNVIKNLEIEEREKTGIKTLKINYNRVFGYFIELTNSVKHLAPYYYKRRQTLTTGERYVTDQLKELEEKLLSAEERFSSLETQLFNEIKNILLSNIDKLKKSANALAELDVIISFARVAKENFYVRPEITSSDQPLKIINGRHPVVEAVSQQSFVANDCILDNNENRTSIITGPNMAGKSTYMRQVATITLMAHIGSFVPADSATIPLVDKIFTRIGASDNLVFDQSTFMVEMAEMAYIINNATSNSLIILDEIGRGTSTFDGLSIAWAIIEHVNNKIKAKTLFATHYHELTELEGVLEGVKNYKVTVKEHLGSIVFLRKIMRGGTNKSFGIEVAKLAGIKNTVTDRAKVILKSLEKNDLTKNKNNFINDEETTSNVKLTEIERIIDDIDVNTLSPMNAFNVLVDLKEKLDKRK